MSRIISLLVTIALVTFNFTNMQAQATADQLPKIAASITADVSADKVWEHIRKLDNIDKVSSVVARVEWNGPKGPGGERKCTTLDGKGYFVEAIKSLDDNQRTYTWHVREGVPAKQVINSLRVVDLGYNKSMIVFNSNYDFIENPNMTEEQFRSFLQTSISEIMTNYVAMARN